jgi:hypothetical protein
VNVFIVVEVSHQGRDLKTFRGKTPGRHMPTTSSVTTRSGGGGGELTKYN